jgi:hypothetical protein
MVGIKQRATALSQTLLICFLLCWYLCRNWRVHSVNLQLNSAYVNVETLLKCDRISSENFAKGNNTTYRRTISACHDCAWWQMHFATRCSIAHVSRGSSVSIVSGYGLNDQTIKVWSPAEAKGFFFSSLCVQTSSGTHPASYTMGTGGPFLGAKARPGRDTDHSPLSCVEVESE